MKVKNIMFAGFMASVLAGACGAAEAATVLASKEFVTTELGKKQDTLEQGDNIVIEGNKISAVQYDATALTQKVTDLETTVGTLPEGTEATTIVGYITEKTTGIATNTALGELQTAVNTLNGDASVAGSVAKQIADAVADKQDKLTFDDTPTENSTNPVKSGGVYTALSGKADVADIPIVPTNVSAFTNDANYVTSTVLEGKGYQTASEVSTAITNAEIAQSQVTGLTAALDDKADVADIPTVPTNVSAFTNDANYVTSTVLEGKGYQTASEVSTAITNAEIAQSQVTGLTNALDGKVDDADLDDYYTKTQADAAFLEDAGLADGAAYLVTKNAEGKVVYSEVSVIDGDGNTVIGKAQQ